MLEQLRSNGCFLARERSASQRLTIRTSAHSASNRFPEPHGRHVSLAASPTHSIDVVAFDSVLVLPTPGEVRMLS
jgi:hypothetical protein